MVEGSRILLYKSETNREKKIGNIFGATGGNYAGNVYDKNYIAPAINTCQGGYREPIIIEKYEERKY